jgi:hypothetical protein
MANPTGGGGKFTIIEKKFDVKEATLRDVVDMYVDQSVKAGKFKKDKGAGYKAQFNKFKEFLDRPVIEFLDGSTDENNALVRLFEKEKSVNNRRAAYSAVKGIEVNVSRQIGLSSDPELKHFKTDGLPTLTNTVVNPDKPGARGVRFAFNYAKLGKLQLELLKHAKSNPKDIPIVRAALAGLHLGLRPNEIRNMPMTALIKAQEGSVAPGLFVSADATKMNFAIDIPASSQVHGILQSAQRSNIQRFGNKKDIPNLMFLTDEGKALPEGAVTKLLKKMKVPNIVQDKETGKFLDNLANAYDLRRINSTAAFEIGIPLNVSAAMKGRAITSLGGAGAGSEPQYVSSVSGLYQPGRVEPHEKLSSYIHNQMNKELKIEEGKLISSDQDFVSNYVKNNKVITVDKNQGQRYGMSFDVEKNVNIAKLPDQTDIIEGEFKEVLTPKTPQDVVSSITAEEKEKLKLLGIDVEEAFKNVKTVGKAVVKKIPIVAGVAVTADMLRRGFAPSTAIAYGASELLPISASDVDTAGAFARKAREEGLPKAIGLDTEKQEQMNIMRKQRLADRVKRNTSVTPPPEEGFINQNEIGRQ